jgi:hypothetical protein
MTRTTRVLVLIVLLPLLLISGCGPASSTAQSGQNSNSPSGTSADSQAIDTNCPTENTIAFAKTKFVLHTGLAFGAFHRWLYKPYKNDGFSKGASGRTVAFVKGGLAALFIKREIRLASEDVKASPALCQTLAAPLAKIGNGIQAAVDKLRNGDPSGIEDTQNSLTGIEDTSAKSGDPISENENADLTSTPN